MGHVCLQKWYLEVALKHKSKIVRLCRGPFINSVVVVHPDTARVACGQGLVHKKKLKMCIA